MTILSSAIFCISFLTTLVFCAVRVSKLDQYKDDVLAKHNEYRETALPNSTDALSVDPSKRLKRSEKNLIEFPLPEQSKLEKIKEELVAVHNKHRAEAFPKPDTPLKPLEWDETLARGAQAWSDTLNYNWEQINGLTHGNVREFKELTAPDGKKFYVNGNKRVGQNLYYSGTSKPDKPRTEEYKKLQMIRGITSWAMERYVYDYCTNDGKRSRKGVGHYTQLVWSNTKKVGCGGGLYIKGDEEYKFLTCNYWPPGNVGDDKPYKATQPFKDNYKCFKGYGSGYG